MQTPVRTRRTPERAEGWTAEELVVFWYETAEQQEEDAGERIPDPEVLRPREVRTLVVQCLILLAIAGGIVVGLIAA
jgi:hypothetical protein